MTHIGARNARALLGALVAAAALFMLMASPAKADLDIASPTSAAIDGDVNWWNGTNAVSSAGFQYSVYWDAPDGSGNVYVTLARRPLGGGAVEFTRFDGTGGTSAQRLTNVNDGHDTVNIGLSPIDGRVHISWTIHHDDHHYGISDAGCLSQARLSSCTFDWSRWMIPTQRDLDRNGSTRVAVESTATYPYFFNDSAGRLFFTFRFGESSRGNQYLTAYDDRGAWTNTGQFLKGRFQTIDWSETRRACNDRGQTESACHRGIYMGGIQFDDRDRLHAMWTYKEYAAVDGGGIRGIHYAYSDDRGATWFNSADREVGRSSTDSTSTDPISGLEPDSTDTLVLDAPFGWWTYATWLKMDSNNQPHLMVSVSDPPTTSGAEHLASARTLHLWRTGTNTWNSGWVEPAGHGQDGTWGTLMFDDADTAYYLHNHDAIDWTPYNSGIYAQTELSQDQVTWQSGRYLNIVPESAVTDILSVNYIGTAIDTRAGANNTISVSMKNNTVGTTLNVYWATDADPAFTAGKTHSFAISANDRSYQTYNFRVTDSDWRGTLRALEIYPAGMGDVSGAGKDISIDYIRITDDRGRTVKAWEFNEGDSVRVATASSTRNWSSWRIDELLPGVSHPLPDSITAVDMQRYRSTGLVSFPLMEQGTPGNERLSIREFPLLDDSIAKDWEFPVDELGWDDDGSIADFRWSNDGGTLGVGGTISIAGSAIQSLPSLNVPLSGNTVRVIMKHTTTATDGKLWYITNASRTWLGARTVSFRLSRSGYNTYDVDMSRARDWSGGTLYQLALEPTVGATSGTFNVDRIIIRR